MYFYTLYMVEEKLWTYPWTSTAASPSLSSKTLEKNKNIILNAIRHHCTGSIKFNG